MAIERWFSQTGLKDNFYTNKFSSRRLLTREEKETATYLVNNHPRDSLPVYEIGMGCGQFTFLLAWLGYQVTGVEGAPHRAQCAKDCHDKLPKSVQEKMKVIHGQYPIDCNFPCPGILVIHNIVNSWWDTWKHTERYREFFQDHVIILNTRLWWKIREKPAERSELIKEIEEIGYTSRRIFGPVYTFTQLPQKIEQLC